MGIFTLLLLVLIFVAAGWVAVWVKHRLFPASPVTIDYMIWGFVILCIVLFMLHALGIGVPADPKVPKLQ